MHIRVMPECTVVSESTLIWPLHGSNLAGLIKITTEVRMLVRKPLKVGAKIEALESLFPKMLLGET